ncbi:PREDICTED: disco-interacting protein 2 homolog B-A-like [Priapulus caudatus]|uniref:Disco-interacting protein 2 homolog B-A-like n=1 Tax=Priapulus caudatus TaxID=37621 RepID=A0ABM1E9T7_PRICU|nr:PREDICTED: disco-interacting protein 2 homolog B-A-like [Priapulus caudatus]
MAEQQFDFAALPVDVRERLAELELELSEGDITQKGYEKKRRKLLGPYLGSQQVSSVSAAAQQSPTTQAQRRHQRRVTRNESRYHSEIRQEAVQAALAMHRTQKHNLPMPSKRSSVMAASPTQDRDASDFSDEHRSALYQRQDDRHFRAAPQRPRSSAVLPLCRRKSR